MEDHHPPEPQPPERSSSLWPLAMLLLLTAAILLFVQLRRSTRPPVGLGQPLPPLTVAGWLNTDKPPSAADLRGQVVLVDCWASWCGPCVANMPALVDFYQQYHGEGLVVIGLTPERGEELAQLKTYVTQMQGQGLDWPIAYGAGVPIDMMGVYGFPTYMLFDRSGLSVWSGHSFRGLEDAVGRALAQPVASSEPQGAGKGT
jgi:thiol-disulfide isomerase/thioredoxin